MTKTIALLIALVTLAIITAGSVYSCYQINYDSKQEQSQKSDYLGGGEFGGGGGAGRTF